MKTLNTETVSRRAMWGMVFRFAVVAPLPLLAPIFLRLVNASGFALAPVIVLGLTNALINGDQVFFWCSISVAVSAFEILTDVLNYPMQLWFSNRATLHFQGKLLKQTSQIPLLHFLDADFHDLLSRANRGFSDRMVDWFRSVLDNIHGVATLIGLLSTVLIIGGGWCAAVLFLCSVVVLLTQKPIVFLGEKKDRDVARPRRAQETWAEVLTSRTSGGEIRLFMLQNWLLTKWEKSYQTLADVEVTALKKRMKWDALARLSSMVGYAIIIFIAAHAAQNADSKEAVGIFTGLITAAVAFQGFLFFFYGSLGSLAEHSGVLRELATLFTIQSASVEKDSDSDQQLDTNVLPQLNTEHTTIQIDALSFRYPHAAVDTLKDITAKIAPGEIVALVGKNGAGKTTLANILLGLYSPQRGNLEFNAGTHKSSPVVSAVFQNFARFLLPVRDNVGFGDIARIQEENGIQNALVKAGSTFSQDLDAWLGSEFGGRDVSGGEWMRIAVARGLFRNSNFIVFDEPTTSIDPVAEVEMARQLLTKHASRSVIVVSHRLGIARLCDRILVLDAGRMVEQGSHDELISSGGLYAKMWNAQAAWYT